MNSYDIHYGTMLDHQRIAQDTTDATVLLGHDLDLLYRHEMPSDMANWFIGGYGYVGKEVLSTERVPMNSSSLPDRDDYRMMAGAWIVDRCNFGIVYPVGAAALYANYRKSTSDPVAQKKLASYELRGLMVVPGARRRGVARRLINLVVEVAAQIGIVPLMAITHDPSVGARFERCGATPNGLPNLSAEANEELRMQGCWEQKRRNLCSECPRRDGTTWWWPTHDPTFRMPESLRGGVLLGQEART